MKQLLFFIAFTQCTLMAIAQKDSSRVDTVHVGNFIIVKKNKGANINTNNSIMKDWDKTVDITIVKRNRTNNNISTNWWIMDLGFANVRDNTDYTIAQAGTYLKTFRTQDGKPNQNAYQLNTGKSSNLNIWVFMQKRNLYKHIVNLKYGLGSEMYNYRYDSRISYRKDPQPFVYNDSISFTKNKLFLNYITVPLMLNINTNPSNHRSLNVSVGLSAGYLLQSRNKQISAERGKQKIKGDFNFEPWRVASIAEIGLGPIRFYGSYSLNKLQKDITKIDQSPYVVGLRFSNW
ncbi:MAG: outer membrane beta-barrel protein [Sediminibacterium sp.]|jgi:Outer membrane protein beta-barrel domain